MSSCSVRGRPGLPAALAARPVRSALIVTKGTLDAGRRRGRRAGWPGVLDPSDSLENHVRDTLAAGAGLCDEAVGAQARRRGAEGDSLPDAARRRVRSGARRVPSRPRAHPRGRAQPQPHRPRRRRPQRRRGAADAGRVGDGGRGRGAGPGVRPRPRRRHVAAAGERQAAGVRIALLDADGNVESVGMVRARAVVLATGGWGQVFASTSNPPAVTGDGVAMAMRAGLAVQRRRVRPVPSDRACGTARTRSVSRRSSARRSAARARSSTTAPASG